jgi:hypothetical protein
MSVNAKLSKLSASWKKAEPITASFSNIADGDYIGDIKAIVLGESKKGRIQVTLDWEIAEGDFAGKVQKQFYGLSDDKGNADEKGMGYFKNVCEVIGVDLPEDLNLWQDAFDEFAANNTSLFDITAKEKGGYTNVYVNGVSEYTKETEGEATEETATEEELTVEEVTEEEVVEKVEEEVQEVVAPTRKIVAKVAPKAAVKVTAKPVAKAVAVPTKKIVSLNRR